MHLVREGARFCSTRCRVAWHRANRIPDVLRRRPRWVRRDSSKRPWTAWGTQASSTGPETWTTFGEASASDVGVGLGFVLNGDGLGCFDLDHCFAFGVLHPEARWFLRDHPGFWVERSPSGDGLHIWVHAEAQKGWRRSIGSLSVEFYTEGRYMTVTGKKF